MAIKTISELKSFFETGDKPTQQQFWDWLDSYMHKTDALAMSQITGLVALLDYMMALINNSQSAVLITYNATTGSHVLGASELLEKMIIFAPSEIDMNISKVEAGVDVFITSIKVEPGWSDTISLDLFAKGAPLTISLEDMVAGTKIIYVTKKLPIL